MKASDFFRSVALAAALGLLAVLPARAQFGIAAGLNFDSFDQIQTGGGAGDLLDSAGGYHAGIFYDLGAGPVAVRLAAIYKDLGNLEVDGVQVDGLKLTMFEFPVDLHFRLLPVPAINPYVLVGPVLAVPRSEDQTLDEALETIVVSGNVGGGFKIDLGSITLTPEFRYTIAVTDLTGDQFTIAGQSFVAAEKQRSNSIQLRLGLRF